MSTERRRATYLLQSDLALLNTWGRQVRAMFGDMPYLVGSALEHPDYRDVDVRLIVLDVDGEGRHERLTSAVSLPYLNLAVSLWGQKATGLPIDFQVQSMAAANDDPANKGKRRHPIGMGDQAEPVAAPAPTRDEMVAAMQWAWNEFCNDTGCYPEIIEITGTAKRRMVYGHFDRGNFGQMAADHLGIILRKRAGASGEQETNP